MSVGQQDGLLVFLSLMWLQSNIQIHTLPSTVLVTKVSVASDDSLGLCLNADT